MSDLDALLGAPLGELPAAIKRDVVVLALAEIRTARAEIERLHQELGRARTATAVRTKGIHDAHDEIDRLARELGYARSRATALDALRREAGEQLNQATVERDWLLAEASDELRQRFFTTREKERVSHPRPTPHLDHVKRELDTATAEIERLTAERDSALNSWRAAVDYAARIERELSAQRDAARTELRECREQLDDARDAYGDKLCPRCSVEVAAEAAAEKENTDG